MSDYLALLRAADDELRRQAREVLDDLFAASVWATAQALLVLEQADARPTEKTPKTDDANPATGGTLGAPETP